MNNQKYINTLIEMNKILEPHEIQFNLKDLTKIISFIEIIMKSKNSNLQLTSLNIFKNNSNKFVYKDKDFILLNNISTDYIIYITMILFITSDDPFPYIRSTILKLLYSLNHMINLNSSVNENILDFSKIMIYISYISFFKDIKKTIDLIDEYNLYNKKLLEKETFVIKNQYAYEIIVDILTNLYMILKKSINNTIKSRLIIYLIDTLNKFFLFFIDYIIFTYQNIIFLQKDCVFFNFILLSYDYSILIEKLKINFKNESIILGKIDIFEDCFLKIHCEFISYIENNSFLCFFYDDYLNILSNKEIILPLFCKSYPEDYINNNSLSKKIDYLVWILNKLDENNNEYNYKNKYYDRLEECFSFNPEYPNRTYIGKEILVEYMNKEIYNKQILEYQSYISIGYKKYKPSLFYPSTGYSIIFSFNFFPIKKYYHNSNKGYSYNEKVVTSNIVDYLYKTNNNNKENNRQYCLFSLYNKENNIVNLSLFINSNSLLCIEINSKIFELKNFNLIERKNYICWILHYSNNILSININDYSEVIKADYPYYKSFEILIGAQVCLNKKRYSENSNVTFDPNPNVISANQINNYFSGEIGTILIYNTTTNISNAIISSIIKNIDKTDYENLITKSLSDKLLSNTNYLNKDYEIESLSTFLQIKGIKRIKEKDHINIVNLLNSLSKSNFLIMTCSTKGVNKEYYSNYYNIGFSSIFDSYRSNFFSEGEYFIDFNKMKSDSVYNIGYPSCLYINEFHDHNIINKDFLKKFYSNDSILRRKIIINNIYIRNFEIKDKKHQKLIEYTNELYLYSNQQSIQIRKYIPFSKYIEDNLYIIINLLNEKLGKKVKQTIKFDNHEENSIKLVNFTELLYNYKKLTIDDYTILQTYIISVLEESYFNIDLLLITQYFLSITNIKYYDLNNHSFYTIDMIQNNIRILFLVDNWIELLNQIIKIIYSDKDYGTSSNTNTGNFSNSSNVSNAKNINDRNQLLIQMNLYINIFNNGEISLSSKNNLQYFIHYFYYQRSNLFYNIFNFSLYINPYFSYYSYVYQITNMGLSCVNDEYFLINSKNFGQVLSFIYFIADDNYKINSEEYYTEFTIKFNSLIKEFVAISITKKDSSIFNVFINFFWINKKNTKILFYSLQSFFFIEGLYANIISQNVICVEDFIEILINLLLYISENNENNINDNYFNNLSIGIILQILDLAYFKNRNINIKILFTNKSPKQNNNKRSLSILNAYNSFSKNKNQIIVPTVSSKNLNTIINSDKNLYKSNINVFKNIVRRHSRYKNMSTDTIRKNMKSKLKFSYKIISKDEYDNKLTLYSNLINYYIESENIYALRSLFLYCFNLKTKKKQSIEFIKLENIKNLKLKLHTRSKKFLNIFVNSYERKVVLLKEKNDSKSTKFFEGVYFLFELLIQSCIKFTKTNFEIKNSLYSLYESSKYGINFDDSFFSADESDIDSVCSSSYKNMNIRRYSNESFKSNQSNISNIESNIKKKKSIYNSSIISLIIDDNDSKQLLYEIISSKYIFNKIFFLTLDNYKKNTDLYQRTIYHIYDSIFFLTFDNMKPFYYDLIFLLFINKLLSYDILLFFFETIISRIRYTYEDNLNVITCDIIYNIKKILTLYFKSINYIYFNSNSYILIKEDKINEIRKTINIKKEERKRNEIQKIDEDDSNSFDESKSNSKNENIIHFENVVSYHSLNKSKLSMSKNKEDNVSIKKKVNKELKKSIKSFIENKKFIKTFTDILYLVINSNIHLMSNISFYVNESNLSYNETFKKTFIELLFEICLSLFKITGNNIYIELFLDEIERKKNSKIQNGTVVIFADLFTETEKLYSQAFSIIKPTNNLMLERLNYIGMDLKSKSNDYFIGNQYLLSENLVSICLREYIEVSKIFLNEVNIENILKRKLYFPFLSEEISEIEYLGVYDDLLDDDIKSSREYKDHLTIIKESKTSDKTVSFIRKLDKNIKTLIKILSKIIELSTNDLFKIKVIKEYINNKNIKNTKEIKKQKTILNDNKISNTTSNNPFLVVLNEIIIDKYTKVRNEGKIESIIKNIDMIFINWSELINEFFDKLNIYFKNQNELDLVIYNYNHQFSTILDFYYIINDYDLLTYYKYKNEINSLYIDQLLYNNTEEVNSNNDNFVKDSDEKIIFLKSKNYLNVLNLIEKLINKENTDDYLFMKKEYNKKNIEKENFSKTECKFYIFLNRIQNTFNQNIIYYKINIDKNQKIKSILDKKFSITENEQYINNNEKSGELLENSLITSNKSLISIYDYPFLSKEEEKIYAENFYYLHNKVINIPEYLEFHINNNFKSLVYQKDMLIKTALSNEEIAKVVNRELINITNSYLINQTPQNQNEEISYYNNSNLSVIDVLNDNLYNIKYLMNIFVKLNNKIEIKLKNEPETTAKISLSYKRKERGSRLSMKKNGIFDFDNNILLNELIENTINKDKFECELVTLEGFYYVNLYIISSYIKINFEVPTNNYIKKTQKYLISSHENDMNKTFQINELTENIREVLYNENRKVYLSGNYLKRESIIININDIKEVIIKEFCNFNQSIEIYFKYNLYSESILLNFFNEDCCNKFILQLENNKKLFKKDIIIKKPIETFISRKYMSDWSEFIISNYDYILLLNKYSSRSIHNPYQYYIFPWTIIEFNESIIDLDSDKIYRDFNYPMTAQYESNKERIISKFNEMLNEKNEESNYDNNNDNNMEPYQQFSNYSTSAYICYYLMRIPPFTNIMIKLQNDKFDNPNRMFFSIKETKHIVCNYDNRELIPEIFILPEILMNINKYSFGVRSNKKLVDHVNLPLWSNNSPYLFVEHMKKSLESKYVNTYLHNWINIIFGNLQRNEKNFTVFSKLNYSNEFKELFISQSNLKDKKSLLDNIINFGMFPSKLYKNCHIERENRLFSNKENKLYEDFLIFLNNQIQLNIARRSNLIKKKKVLFINNSENYLYALICSSNELVEIEVEIYSNIFCKDRELSFELYDFPLKIKKLSSNYHIIEKQLSTYITEIYDCKLFLTISKEKKRVIIYNLIGILDKGKSLLEFDNMKIKIKESELYSKFLDYKKNINKIHIDLYEYPSSICALSSNTIAISLQDANIEIYIINIITNTKEKDKIEYFHYVSLKNNIYHSLILNLKSTTIDNFLISNKANYNKLNKKIRKEKTIPIYLFHIFNYFVVIRDGFSFQIIKSFYLKSGFSSNFLNRNCLYDEYNHILIVLSLSLEDLKSYVTCYSFEGIILSSISSHIGFIEISPYNQSSILQYNYINETIEELNALQLIKTSEASNKQPIFNMKVIDSTSHLFTTTFELFLKNQIEPKNESTIKLDDVLKSIQENSLKYSVVINILSNGDVNLLNLK